jgi:alkylhydroperoxidase family enzyme
VAGPHEDVKAAGPQAAPDAVHGGPWLGDDTLASLLREQKVPWDALEARYGSLLKLVEILLGVVPNCDPYLEIWPPAFRTYNIMVPNFLNLPAPVFGVGGAPGPVLGMGMYVVSRASECPYCSAHACSFALRRGASPEQMARALVADGASFDRGELATVAVARSLARIPCELTAAERDELIGVYGPKRAEWIVLGVVMMGFLNKFMSAVGVELEQPVVDEVVTTIGPDWSPGQAGAALDSSAPAKPPPPADGLATKLRVLPLVPNALRLDGRWQRGVPKAWPAGRATDPAPADRPRLPPALPPPPWGERPGRSRPCCAENLNPRTTVVGLDVKVLAGAVFADVVADNDLAGDVRAAGVGAGRQPLADRRAVAFARSGDLGGSLGADPQRRAALMLSRAASPSPPEIDAGVVSACRDGGLSAPAIVEVVCWLSVLQMLHRLSCFYGKHAPAPPVAA